LQKDFNWDSCIICGSANSFYANEFYKCTKCGHITHVSIPDIDQITNDKYMDLYRKTENVLHESEKMGKRWEMVLRHAKGSKSLLDYGCGAINLFIKKAPQDCGFEILNSFDVNWKTGFYDERVLDIEYDVLTAWHIFEHLLDPRRLLQRIKHKWLFLIIPWIEYVKEEDFASWPHFWSGVHLQFFTRKSLLKLLENYEILEENYTDGEMSCPDHPEWVVGIACRRK